MWRVVKMMNIYVGSTHTSKGNQHLRPLSDEGQERTLSYIFENGKFQCLVKYYEVVWKEICLSKWWKSGNILYKISNESIFNWTSSWGRNLQKMDYDSHRTCSTLDWHQASVGLGPVQFFWYVLFGNLFWDHARASCLKCFSYLIKWEHTICSFLLIP